MYYKNQLYLQHFGIPGMRWGVRRGGPLSGGARAARKREKLAKNPSTYNGLHIKMKPKGPNVKAMSDQELRARINRLNMEKEYSKLNQDSISKGKSAVAGILKDSAKSTVKMYVTKGMVIGAVAIGKLIMDKVKK